MPRIPTITNEINATSLRNTGVMPQTRASADAFGASIGRSMQALAGGADQLGAGLGALEQKRQQETVANAVAQSDFTRRELELRNEVPADGAGYQDRVLEEYTAYVDEQANLIDDDVARMEYRNRMMAQLPAVSSRSAQYEFTLQATHSKEQANASLMALNNKIMTDPTMYETYIEQGFDVLDTRTDINATVREGMKLQWQQDSARARFMGMLERATSIEDIDAIAAELTGTTTGALGDDQAAIDWTEQFSPQDFERMTNLIGTTRSAFVTKADADARAALDTLEQRAGGLQLIPQEELQAVQQLVSRSQNPVTVAKMARIMRDQAIIQESQTLTPSELRAAINGANGNPGVAYPGMTPTLSGAINDASSRFDVSASYLGGTIQREYGQYLTGHSPQGNPQFAPVPTHGGVDVRNIRSDVLDAATVAGELFGAPLQLNSGYRSQQHQNTIIASGDPNRTTVARESHHTSGTAIDISTVGMSEADKARLVGALVDAGFTGIGQYDTHIHGDFRNAVPASFGERDGRVWGGWTYLSPEVSQALADRGFSAGLSSEQIQRARPVQTADNIDYGRGTSITNAQGQPASSATGVMQFTSGTFLDVMKSPGTAARIGVDITNMSDDQILELRRDPYVATMAGAALAEQNKRALQQTLGRPVNDAELYMAHFLGAGGATALLTAFQGQPEQSAAALLPDAARDHRSMFYDRNGRALTVREVYTNISTQFNTAPTQVAYGDNVTRQNVLQNMEQQLSSDPMAFAQSSGSFAITPLDAAQGFQMRGQEARAVADYYNIPVSDIKPFTEDEANSLIKDMQDGSVDDVLQIMTAIQAMGGDVSRAALAQLDQKDSVYAYAAGLQFERGQGSVASDIIRGQKRLEENPAIRDGIGAQPRDLYDAFMRATGGALLDASPEQMQAIQDAATAHYVETVVARSANTQFNQDAFANSVQAVLGGTQGAPAIDNVNGQPTVLPPGITGQQMEQAFDRMTVDDWTRLSEQGVPPRYVTGEVMSPDDLADEAMLRAIGGGKYRIMLADGSYAITGNGAQNGRLEAYVFVPEPDEIRRIATRPVPRDTPVTPGAVVPRDQLVNDDGYLTTEEQQRLIENYGLLHQFDENGRWLGPAGGYTTGGGF